MYNWKELSGAIERGLMGVRDFEFRAMLKREMKRLYFSLQQKLLELQVQCCCDEEIRERYVCFRDVVTRRSLLDMLEYAAAHERMKYPLLFLSLYEYDMYHNPEQSRIFFEDPRNIPLVPRAFFDELESRGLYLAVELVGSGSTVHAVISVYISELWEYPAMLPRHILERAH